VIHVGPLPNLVPLVTHIRCKTPPNFLFSVRFRPSPRPSILFTHFPLKSISSPPNFPLFILTHLHSEEVRIFPSIFLIVSFRFWFSVGLSLFFPSTLARISHAPRDLDSSVPFPSKFRVARFSFFLVPSFSLVEPEEDLFLLSSFCRDLLTHSVPPSK